MVSIVILTFLVAGLNFLSPKAGAHVAWLCVISLLFPVVTYAAGSLVWLALNVLTDFSHTDAESWIWCCACGGMPAAFATAAFVRNRPPPM